MASIISHAVFASGLGAAASPERRMPARYWVTLAVVAALPDADVAIYPLGVNAPHMLGHRGITHSLVFAAVLAALVVRLVFRAPAWRASWVRLWIVFFAAIASHGVLDAMTNGGQGIAFFAPFSAGRWHFAWRPILVSPIGVGAFISMYGVRVLRNEVVWVWLPAALLALAGRLARQRRSPPKELAA